MTRPVDLIVPDSGPLISLAHANRLDLLEVFDRPVVVLDVVRAECLKKPDSPDHDRLRRWFDERRNRISIAMSPIGPVFEAALADERSGRDPHATRGLGEASIVWLLANLERIAGPGSIQLVLVEDRNLSVELSRGAAHVLSTRAWLAGLERAGVIQSASAIISAIGAHGRVIRASGRSARRSGIVVDRGAARRPMSAADDRLTCPRPAPNRRA